MPCRRWPALPRIAQSSARVRGRSAGALQQMPSIIGLLTDKQSVDAFRGNAVPTGFIARDNALPIRPNVLVRGADLSGADLSRGWLGGANLSGADLSNTDLRGADFRTNILVGRTNLSGANLSGANLSGAEGLACDQYSHCEDRQDHEAPRCPELRSKVAVFTAVARVKCARECARDRPDTTHLRPSPPNETRENPSASP